MGLPLVFVDDLDAPVLAPEDHHHLTRVLRARPGDDVEVGDGVGGRRWCRLVAGADADGAAAAGPALEPAGLVEREPQPEPPLTVAFALTKGERPEWVVQKLTELGVDRVVVFGAARSVARWEGKAERQLERLRKVAREAAMQCRRAWLPDVGPLATFEEAAALDGAALAERDGGPPSLARPTLLVGPEGGWSDTERNCGLPLVRLGPHVLRAETAAVAGGALLAALRARAVSSGEILA